MMWDDTKMVVIGGIMLTLWFFSAIVVGCKPVEPPEHWVIEYRDSGGVLRTIEARRVSMTTRADNCLAYIPPGVRGLKWTLVCSPEIYARKVTVHEDNR